MKSWRRMIFIAVLCCFGAAMLANVCGAQAILREKSLSEEFVNVSYLQVRGLDDRQLQKKINEELKRIAVDDYTKFKNIKQSIMKNPTESDKYYAETKFEARYMDDSLLSLSVYSMYRTSGSENMMRLQGYTFSLTDGKLLKVRDIIDWSPTERQAVCDSINAQLAEKNIAYSVKDIEDFIKYEGANPNYYLLGPDKLVFVFNPGEINFDIVTFEYTSLH